MAKLPIGPWPEGTDNVQDEYSEVFQPNEAGQCRLTEAVNVDLDNQGWPNLRNGTTERLTGTSFLNGGSYAGLFLLQDGGSILSVTEGSPFTSTSAVTGLNASAKVHFEEAFGQVFYTNGLVSGRILSNETALPWGLGVAPSPTLGTTAGTLAAGRYRVAATLVNANDQDRAGNTIATEGGGSKATAVSVNGSQDITATLTPGDANATHVNFYISQVNGEELHFAKQVAVGALPATISDARYSKRPIRTQHMRGPIPGDGIFSYLGFLMIWRDNWIFRSKGQTPNLFYPREEVLGFGWDIRQCLGVKDGFYVATERGLNWITGAEPAEWKQDKKDEMVYAAGGLVMDGEQIPALETMDKVAVFGSDHGLTIGLPGGQVRYLTHERLNVSAPALASFLYRSSGDIRQILMHLA